MEGIKRSLWFPSRGKRLAEGNQKKSLVPFKRETAGRRESKEVFGSLHEGNDSQVHNFV
jgi:hypothetical protein